MTDKRIIEILSRYPFLTYAKMHDAEYIGIIQNADNQFVAMYVMDLIPSEAAREQFLNYGNEWWWNSNRKIPINVFLKDDGFKVFKQHLRMFSAKEFEIIMGPVVSLTETMNKRIRKRKVIFVRNIP